MAIIITKSQRSFINQVFPEYYKISIVDGVLKDEEITAQEAKDYIKEHELPEIYRLDHNNIIWGDDSFKLELPEKYKTILCNNEVL
jgi:hypothetical protein